MQLKSRTGPFPPKGWEFVDSRTGMKFNGMEAAFDDQVRRVIKHRKANPHIYSPDQGQFLDFDQVSHELADFTCQRLKHTSQFCHNGAPDTKAPVNYIVQQPKIKCFKCDHDQFDPKYCKTCSGSKIKAWICQKCHSENPV